MPNEEILQQLLNQVRGRYYGKYRGFVVNNEDPQRIGRLQLRVPAVLGEQITGWALPCMPFGGLSDQGLFSVPEAGAQVWVEFEAGDPDMPIWSGTFWQASGDLPTEVQNPPTTRLFKTPKGHYWLFEDADDAEQFHLEHSAGATLDIDNNGTVALTDAGGSTLTLDAENNQITLEDSNGNCLTMSKAGTTVEDANGNKIEMASSGIKVKGTQVVVEGKQVMLGGSGGEPVIKGQSFLTLFATHVHTCTAPGSPTSPPVPQGEMSSLSMKVMTS
jgi:uncharacterized protein involved in type VI secretion and phage assembly